MVENRDTGPDVERPAERPKIRPPGVVARNRRMVGDSLRYRVFLEARQGLEAKSAFFQPDGREAEAVFFEATGSRSYRDVIRGQGYERYTRTYTEDLGGGRYETRIIPFGERRKDFAYKFSFTSSAMRILLRNYLQKAHGHFSDEFFAEAEKVLQECMKAQAAGTRKIELMIPLAQIKVLQSCPEFREDPRFQAFLEKTKELEVKLEETRRQAFFRFETRPWAGMAKDGMGYSGAEGDIEYDKYDLRKVRARLTETLEAYLEATDDCLSEKFLAEALALAEQYGETEPPSMSPAGETMNEYQQYQAALRNAEIVRACCQLGEILSCSRLLDNPQYFPVIRALCKLPSGVPHPWGLISYYPRTDAMPGVSMEHLHVFQSLIEDDELWEAKNPHARNYLFEAIASILGYLRDHHHPYSYSGEIKGGDTIYPRIAILRQNLRHQGDLVANKRIVETLRDGGEIKVVERVAKEEGDTDFGRLLQRILKDDLEGITSWSKREGSTTYYAYSRRNPWQASGGGI